MTAIVQTTSLVTAATALVVAIAHVLDMRTVPQMVGTNARRVVATVAEYFAGLLPRHDKIADTMSEK